MMAKKKKMSQLIEDLHIYPQVLVNVKVKDKAVAQADVDALRGHWAYSYSGIWNRAVNPCNGRSRN